MKQQIALALASIALLGITGCSTHKSGNDRDASSPNIIDLKIDYGAEKPARTVQVPFIKGQTALQALQRAATVETHPVAGYVFVTAIDGIKGIRGETAWYYKINGIAPGKLATSNRIEDPCHMTWIFTKDHCSSKVDCNKP